MERVCLITRKRLAAPRGCLQPGSRSKRDFCGKGGMERSPFRCGIGGQFRSAGTRARILGKRKGPERDLAPGPCLVPLTGVEPVRYHYLGILSPVCLPISPQRLIQVSNKILYITTVIKSRNARVQPFSRHKKGDGINPSPFFISALSVQTDTKIIRTAWPAWSDARTCPLRS